MPTDTIPPPESADGKLLPAAAPVDLRDPWVLSLAPWSQMVGPIVALAPLATVVSQLDEQERESHLGDRLRTYMLRDPAVRASVEFLVLAALAPGWRVRPAKVLPPGADPEVAASDPDLARAAEISAFVEWALKDLDRPFTQTLREMARDAFCYRSKLAEPEWDDVRGGDYDGKLAIKRIGIKPRRSWNWVVDPTGRVLGIRARTLAGWQVFDRSAFWIATWDARDGDPRGTSGLESAEQPWSMRQQIRPSHFRFQARFGMPVQYATPPPGTELIRDQDPTTNMVVSTPAVPYVANLLTQIVGGHTVLALPGGSTYEMKEPQSDGSSYINFHEFTRDEIFLGITLAVRLLAESKHNSRADSGTAQDVAGNPVRFVAEWIAASATNDIAYPLTLHNFGYDDAARFTPTIELKAVEHQDLPNLIKALAQIGLKLAPEQVPAVFALLGLPDVTVDQATEAMAKPSPAPNPFGGGNPPGTDQQPPADGENPDDQATGEPE